MIDRTPYKGHDVDALARARFAQPPVHRHAALFDRLGPGTKGHDMRKFLLIVAAVALVAVVSSPVRAQVGDLIWEENFNTLDNWLKITGNGSWGWGNGELEFYKNENVDIAGHRVTGFHGVGSAGLNAVRWDGRDDEGATPPPASTGTGCRRADARRTASWCW